MFGLSDYPRIHDRPSLLTFIQSHLDQEGRLADPLCALPDAKPLAPSEIGWMTGAFDGVMSHHMGDAGSEGEVARRLAESIAVASAKPRRRQLKNLYGDLAKEDTLTFIDPMIEHLAQMRPSTSDIARLGAWLAAESPDRNPVKVGIALLGSTGAPDGSVIHELGAHEEFTLYAVIAFSNARENPEPDIVALAKRVQGWGRIHCVEQLRDTTDPMTARWILTEGFRNSIMNEYLAYIAATTGDLAGALADQSPSPDVLAAAAEIIDALLMGGPAEDIDDYEDAPVAMSRWLGHMEGRVQWLGECLTLHAVQQFCEQDGWEDRLGRHGWTQEVRDHLRASAIRLLEHPEWRILATTGLESDDLLEFWNAERAARILGIDPFEQLLVRIDADPLDGPWFQAWQDVTRDRAELLVERAARLLDLSSIATGPSTAIGLGPEFKPHAALGWTLQGLQAHPDLGRDIVASALFSPSIQNRNGALTLLEVVSPSDWPDEHRERLQTLATSDPDERVRQRVYDLLLKANDDR